MTSGGQFGKDYEEAINFDRLTLDRLRKTREAMRKHGLGATVPARLAKARYITGFRGILREGKDSAVV